MTTNSVINNRTKNKNNLSKQLEQEQNHRYGDYLEGYQQGGGRGRMQENIQGLRSVIGRYKKDRVKLRIV